jgi:protein arginine kinase activator
MADPLHCAVCQAPATVHLTQIAQGAVSKIHLCECCAAKGGALEAPVFQLAGLLGIHAGHAARPAGDIACPECGLTDAEFKKTARFGCVHCYDLFSDNLAALLPRIQPGRTHGGKHPAGARVHAARSELIRRKEELKRAVTAENYEAAARTRDIMKALDDEIAALGLPE